ncbi:MAG TPA: hypothetical protein VFT50_15795 [Baekduia sp.]|nr:hypothetical protein [Baekduia sp.]
MSAPARLAAFAAAIAVLFGGTVAAGRAIGGGSDDARPASARGSSAGMTGMDTGHGAEAAGDHDGDEPSTAVAPGLAVAQGGLRLEAPSRARAGRTTTFAFRIVDAHGAPVRRFAVEHARRLHLIVVRRDLTGFQHLHPRMDPSGRWTTQLRLPTAGAYRVFADVRPVGSEKVTLASDVLVGGRFSPRALPAPSTTAMTADGYQVSLDGTAGAGREGELRFTVRRDGRPVAVQPYLGADGHLVALRDGDLAYLHVHPTDGRAPGRIGFMAEYPSAGRYRLFLQFRHAGRVHTAAFTQEVPAA